MAGIGKFYRENKPKPKLARFGTPFDLAAFRTGVKNRRTWGY